MVCVEKINTMMQYLKNLMEKENSSTPVHVTLLSDTIAQFFSIEDKVEIKVQSNIVWIYSINKCKNW